MNIAYNRSLIRNTLAHGEGSRESSKKDKEGVNKDKDLASI